MCRFEEGGLAGVEPARLTGDVERVGLRLLGPAMGLATGTSGGDGVGEGDDIFCGQSMECSACCPPFALRGTALKPDEGLWPRMESAPPLLVGAGALRPAAAGADPGGRARAGTAAAAEMTAEAAEGDGVGASSPIKSPLLVFWSASGPFIDRACLDAAADLAVPAAPPDADLCAGGADDEGAEAADDARAVAVPFAAAGPGVALPAPAPSRDKKAALS